MKVRLLKKSDINAAGAIVGSNYSKAWQKKSMLEMKSMFSNAAIRPVYYVAEDRGKIVGFIGFTQSWMDYNVYEIFWVNVLPDRQREGIGKKLVAKAIKEIKKQDSHIIQLTARSHNAKYYKQHFGFRTLECFGPQKYRLMSLVVRKAIK